jgi:hypothetical protein
VHTTVANEGDTPNCQLFNPKPYRGEERPDRQIEMESRRFQIMLNRHRACIVVKAQAMVLNPLAAMTKAAVRRQHASILSIQALLRAHHPARERDSSWRFGRSRSLPNASSREGLLSAAHCAPTAGKRRKPRLLCDKPAPVIRRADQGLHKRTILNESAALFAPSEINLPNLNAPHHPCFRAGDSFAFLYSEEGHRLERKFSEWRWAEERAFLPGRRSREENLAALVKVASELSAQSPAAREASGTTPHGSGPLSVPDDSAAGSEYQYTGGARLRDSCSASMV